MKTSKELKTFTLYRTADASGVSGTGRILDGVIFHNGWVVACWRTDIEGTKHGHSSMGTYPSWESFKYIHIDSHPENRSIVIFGNDSKLASKLALKKKR
jgi:hypothetical protein